MWRAFTCTAFTALLDESTKPLVSDPRTPGWVVVEVPSALSSCRGDFGDKCNPKPLVKRANGDFPAFPGCESSWGDGCGILRLLAHEDMPEAENSDGACLAEVSCPFEAKF